jgi:hypothetical protein
MKRCPTCRTSIADADETCSCGEDLAEIRAELARLMRPSALWHGDTPVIPMAPFRKLKPDARQELLSAIRAAFDSVIKRKR